jgi:hypothetical protein
MDIMNIDSMFVVVDRFWRNYIKDVKGSEAIRSGSMMLSACNFEEHILPIEPMFSIVPLQFCWSVNANTNDAIPIQRRRIIAVTFRYTMQFYSLNDGWVFHEALRNKSCKDPYQVMITEVTSKCAMSSAMFEPAVTDITVRCDWEYMRSFKMHKMQGMLEETEREKAIREWEE